MIMRLPNISCRDRESFFLERAAGKKTLHLGCADWPFTKERLQKKELLHCKLANSTQELFGVDIASEGVEILKSAGYQNLFILNPEKDLFENFQQKFEIIIAGEVLEHVGNPQTFLKSVSPVFDVGSRLLISVPNFASIKRFPRLLLKSEIVHPDHLFYFSYFTLKKLLNISGFEISEFFSYWGDNSYLGKIVNLLFKNSSFFQYYSDGFCATGVLKK